MVNTQSILSSGGTIPQSSPNKVLSLNPPESEKSDASAAISFVNAAHNLGLIGLDMVVAA